MSDTAERLRQCARDSLNHDCPYAQEMLDAADEIEQARNGLLEIIRYYDSGGDQRITFKRIAEQALLGRGA